ncbi:Methyltransferase domain-containing protein [Caloramator quimbayensis]|uniref:Methyltransferase domain-containing protein n=1 Tax=Caloramator quimbayensis TaxID=1147123 RepID=A0A1T4WQD3_9CLOT|nr:class I SAM-dependent methyltransferase [Caloramator quimbayensis]SKA79317.1 Methyltransferase domain-containing protein [Caloramator quimbayensis]
MEDYNVVKNVDTCLDIGCGKGELSFMLSKQSKRVIAVDLADKMIERAKILHVNKNIDYICGNILDMEFENNSLDVIITTATAHHFLMSGFLVLQRINLKKSC